MRRFLSILFLSLPCILFGENPWFPGLDGEFNITPNLPKKFMVGSPSTPPDVYDGIIWGTQMGVKAFIEEEKKPSSPIVSVKMSQTVEQDGPMSFRGDAGMKRELRVMGRSKLKIKKYRWGNYPVLSILGISRAGIHYYIAFVGLNREDKKTLMLTYLTPHDKNRPTEKELKLWENLIKESGSGSS